jgi:DNA-binding Xre family transcriptional regulator
MICEKCGNNPDVHCPECEEFKELMDECLAIGCTHPKTALQKAYGEGKLAGIKLIKKRRHEMRDRDFCKRLVEIRTAKGLTQAQLENRAGLPATLISHYEKGERAPGLENIKALCRGLECTASDLLGV